MSRIFDDPNGPSPSDFCRRCKKEREDCTCPEEDE